MKKEKICSVTIWYNANKDMWKNVQTYLPFMDCCIIVDNSLTDNKVLLKKSKKVIYIPNKKNLGIATALNQGCEKAKNQGYKWVMTMDQDSSFEGKELKKYLLEVKKIVEEDKRAVCFSPNYNRPFKNEASKVKSVITSGNIISLPIWEEVGKFDEKLFINEVDTIFCYRLISKGYFIYQIDSARMNHNMFDDYLHVRIFGKDYHIRQNDSPTAKYYITRNSFEKNRLFPKITENRLFLIKLLIKVILFEYKKIEKLKMIWKGYRDYRQRKFGIIKYKF
jgi:rhamnosyltransferase